MKNRFLILCLGLFIFLGCKKKEETCSFNPCAYVAPASEIQAVQAYLANNGITTAIQHCSGLFYEIVSPGADKAPTACSTVNAKYVGRLANGSQFDAGTVDFPLENVIVGWQIGIPLIKQGGRIKLYIPPTLGYGNRPNGTIPANSILIFDVTLNTVY